MRTLKLVSICLLTVIYLPISSQIKVEANGNVKLGGTFDIIESNNKYTLGSTQIDEIIFKNSSDNIIRLRIGSGPYNEEIALLPESDTWGYIGTNSERFYEIHGCSVYAYYELLNLSDERRKKNITNLNNALNIVNRMDAKRFDFIMDENPEELENVPDSTSNDSYLMKKKAKFQEISKNKIGYMAQELQTVLPEAVTYKEDADEYYINYIMIIPVLAEAIKELEERVVYLEDKLAVSDAENDLKSASLPFNNENPTGNETRNFLGQNTPNPFNNTTIINYSLAEGVSSAQILVFDMNGTWIKTYNLALDDKELQIKGSSLLAGMYIYSLICDNKEVDSKRMILTN
jgi:hypothetical protein